MINLELSTYECEIINVQAQAVPQQGQYIHHNDRVFIVESVVFQIDKKNIHIAVLEMC